MTYTYGNDPAANSKGRLTAVSSSVSTYGYTAFDVMGRVAASSQTADGVTYTMPEYKYDLLGDLTSEEYPSGRVVETQYDAPAGMRDWQVVNASAWGLGLSGRPEGARPLQGALERFRVVRATTPPYLPELLQDTMNTNDVVRRIGLRSFYTRQF